MQSIYLIILAIFLCLIVVPIPIALEIKYSPYKNFGNLTIKIIGLKIFVATFSVKGMGLIITTKKGIEYQQFDISVSKRQLVYMQNLVYQIKDKIKVKYLCVNAKIGTGEALNTAMTIGILNMIFGSLFGFVKNEKQTATMLLNISPNWDTKVFDVMLFTNVAISFYDVIFCLVYANIKARREKDDKRQRRKFGRKFN